MEVKTGKPYYDDKIFPAVEQGKYPFNWIAGLFVLELFKEENMTWFDENVDEV